MARLRIATYNINGIRARLGALLEWLEREQPDIVCLQELKAPDEAFPAADIEALGYGAIWHGQKSWNGVAILARGSLPVERRRGLPGGDSDDHSRYLEASVHGLVVGCLYLPNGNPWPGPKFEYKLQWFERLIRHAKGLLRSGEPTVLAGDFNVVPTDELDIYDPRSWRKDALLQPESREAYLRLLGQGWTDSLRTVAGDAKVFTFWDYFRKHWERDAGLRIDHLLLDPSLAHTLADAGVDRWVRGRVGASDHAPTWVELDIGGVGAGRAKRGAASGGRTAAPAKKAGAKRGAAAKKPGASSASQVRTKQVDLLGDATAPRRGSGASSPAPTSSKAMKAVAAKGAPARNAAVKTAAAKKAPAKEATAKKATARRAAQDKPVAKKKPGMQSAEKKRGPGVSAPNKTVGRKNAGGSSRS